MRYSQIDFPYYKVAHELALKRYGNCTTSCRGTSLLWCEVPSDAGAPREGPEAANARTVSRCNGSCDVHRELPQVEGKILRFLGACFPFLFFPIFFPFVSGSFLCFPSFSFQDAPERNQLSINAESRPYTISCPGEGILMYIPWNRGYSLPSEYRTLRT